MSNLPRKIGLKTVNIFIAILLAVISLHMVFPVFLSGFMHKVLLNIITVQDIIGLLCIAIAWWTWKEEIHLSQTISRVVNYLMAKKIITAMLVFTALYLFGPSNILVGGLLDYKFVLNWISLAKIIGMLYIVMAWRLFVITQNA
jgi:hypothetical protein